MILTPRNLFFIDAIGGALSALCLGIVLPALNGYFGVPPVVLYSLALVACVFCFYSFGNYLFPHRHAILFLKGIAMANIVYCLITAAVMIYYRQSLTMLAHVYFLIEIVLILVLVKMEWSVLKQSAIGEKQQKL